MTQPGSLLPKTATEPANPEPVAPFVGLLDVVLPVTIVLGTGTVSVRRCLALQPDSILRLHESAGEDLIIVVNGIRLARGEVMIVEDSTAVRVTSIPKAAAPEPAQS